MGQSSVQWPCFHERKYLALQARQIELPRLSSRGPLMISLQSAVFTRQTSVQWPCFHERKYLALQARQIELPRLSSRGPLMISRQSSFGSLQFNGHIFMSANTWLFKPGKLNCPDFQVEGRSCSVGSFQSTVSSRQSAVIGNL